MAAFLQNLASVVPLAAAISLLFFLFVLLAQSVFPRRKASEQRLYRMAHNLALFVVNSVIFRLLVPISLVVVAGYGEQNQIGLFNQIEWSLGLEILLCFLFLDFAIYWQHVATHKVGFLWAMHKVHHADVEMDVTTAIRFHPFELLLSLAYKSTLVLLVGASQSAVFVFELLLFIGPAFNHSNLKLHSGADRFIRLMLVTPDVHRTHHSTKQAEQQKNYGFFIIWWDQLFGSYQAEPELGHNAMTLGLNEETSPGLNKETSPGLNKETSPGLNKETSPGLNKETSSDMLSVWQMLKAPLVK